MSATVYRLPDLGKTLLENALEACERNEHLIHNGREIIVSPTVLPGWRKVVVKVKPAPCDRIPVTLNRKEQACAG